MSKFNRAIIIVLDSVGVGALPDAASYGDEGSNTLGNIDRSLGGIELPNMEKLGLGNILPLLKIKKLEHPEGCFGKMMTLSAGKDTTIGHWEIAGIITEKPFPTYPHGFPEEIIKEFERQTGRKALGNKAASGTVIIDELAEEHFKTGGFIVYTSADSVFQIAAHEELIPLSELYDACQKARVIMSGSHAVARIIARPFIGTEGSYKRTDHRHDFSLPPPKYSLLDHVKEAGMEVISIGKINDIFCGHGITQHYGTEGNTDGINKTIFHIKEPSRGLIFVNLVDFDMRYGHRNNVKGYADALFEFDHALAEIRSVMRQDDVLFITADHGCDPTTSGTDHSREYVPLLVYSHSLGGGVNLGCRHSLADLGVTVSQLLNIKPLQHGESFWDIINK